jgi:ligand-binding sensor domain-containing protein
VLAASYAQEPNYLFEHLGVKDGLYEETLGAVQQDAKGFIWVNTSTVVQRYDGHRFISFFPGRRLPEGAIRSMTIDKKNRIWLLIGDSYFGYLNPDDFSYHPVKIEAPASFGGIPSGMYINRRDDVMLIYDKLGYVTYTDASGVAALRNNPFALPPGWQLIHLWQDAKFNYWIGTVQGLVKYNSSTSQISYRGHNIENDPVIKVFENVPSVNSLYLDKSNRFWMISWQNPGLSIQSFNIKTGERTEWASIVGKTINNQYYVPFGVMETTDGNIWLAGDNVFGKFNIQENSFLLIPNNTPGQYSLLYDIVTYMFEDKEKSIWLGSNKGLYRFSPGSQKFLTVKIRVPGSATQDKADVTHFLQTSNGELLVSTWGKGIYSFDTTFKPAYTRYTASGIATNYGMVWNMLERKNGDIWCAMQGGAVFILTPDKKFIHLILPEAEGQTIRQIKEDKHGNIWMGTQKGAVIQWKASENRFTQKQKFRGLISRLYVDSYNELWVCTDIDGVYRLNTATGEILAHYTNKAPKGKSLLINGASDVLQYNDSMYYISGNGINILNRSTGGLKYFAADNGLPNIQISNLVKDKNGYIWMTSAGGIMSYHPVLSKLSSYTAADGIDNYNFNAGAAVLLKNGNIALGTNKDFIVFNPEIFTVKKYPPPKVQVAGVEIKNKRHLVDSLLKLETIKLLPGENSFKFLLSTLKFQDVHQIRYKLEPIDKEWKVAGGMNVIEYNYLPPGKYVLKAACFGEDGKPGEITAVAIHIEAPFYMQWWFFSVIALAVTGLIIWIDRERMKRKEAIHKMRSNIAGKLHEDVNLALNNINILSEIARLKADTEPEKSKEFIEQIHNKSHHMMIAMDDMLWSIAPENDSMEKTIERMREFIDAQMNRYAVHIELIIDERLKHLNLPMQLRHEAFLLFKESINGLLDAKADDIRIQMGLDKSSLLYMIECNNDHCDLEELNRFLNNRELAEKLDGIRAKLDIHIQKSYAVVECRIPLVPA